MAIATICVPARKKSERLENKLSIKIGGVSVLQHTLKSCLDAVSAYPRVFDGVCLLHDFEKPPLEDNFVVKHEKLFFRNTPECGNGTDRVASAFNFSNQSEFVQILIVQADQPFLAKEALLKCLDMLHYSKSDVSTLCVRKNDMTGSENPKNVKLVKDRYGKVFYFSRRSIHAENYWFRHVGVYCYLPESLRDYSLQPSSDLESWENLEQNRGLEMGLSYSAAEIPESWAGFSINDKFDVDDMEGWLEECG